MDFNQDKDNPFDLYSFDDMNQQLHLESHSLPVDSFFNDLFQEQSSNLFGYPPDFLTDNFIQAKEQPRSNLSAMLDTQDKKSHPIPIASHTTSHLSSSVPVHTVDHQRRLNELQARFRVNYSNNNTTNTNTNPKRPLDKKERTPLKPVRLQSTHRLKSTEPNSPSTSPHELSSSFPSRTMPIQIQRVPRLPSQPADLEQRQKRLDDQLVKADFDDITVAELKEMLRQRGKPATGKKAVLLQRLQEEREMIQHARIHGIPVMHPNFSMDIPYAASVPQSVFSSSPLSSSLNGLHRSIADMHIGSPPIAQPPPPPPISLSTQQSRRFAPYNNTRPLAHSIPNAGYSSSVPTLNSLDRMMMMQQTQPFSVTQQPEEDEDISLNTMSTKPQAIPIHSSNTHHSYHDTMMDWADPSLDFLLQPGHELNEDVLSMMYSATMGHMDDRMGHDLTGEMFDHTRNHPFS